MSTHIVCEFPYFFLLFVTLVTYSRETGIGDDEPRQRQDIALITQQLHLTMKQREQRGPYVGMV